MDMSYLKDMPIAILGAGAVGKTMAADCALEGKEVRLWDQPRFATKYFYKPVELRPMEEILESLKALEREADGMLAEIMEGIQ